MGFDIQMVEPPTKAEVARAKLDADPGYFRFTSSAMPVMVVTMIWAGAVVSEAAPPWPAWPPKQTPAARSELLQAAVLDKTLEPKLTVSERRATIVMRGKLAKVRATRSKHAGRVPSFKFETNDGYIVTAAENTIITTKLRSFAKRVTANELAQLDTLYRESQQPLLDAAKQRGETVIAGDRGLGMSLDDYRSWIEAWAAYNEIAASHRGYSVD